MKPAPTTSEGGARLLAGEELRPRRPGAVSYADGSITVRALPGGLRILTSPLRLNGAHYPLLRLRISGLDASSRLTFIWMLDDRLQSRFAQPLGHPFEDEILVDLSGVAGWQGQPVRTVGVQLSGTPDDSNVQIHSLRFESPSTGTALRLLGGELLRFRPWGLQSINTLDSATAPLGIPLDYAGTIFGLLALLGTATIASLRRSWRALRGRALWLVGLTVWGALSLPWTYSLALQGDLSRQAYRLAEGKPRTINGADQQLQQIAQQVKDRVSAAGARLFLLHESSGHDFYRLRLQHHLLPLNVYNFDATPPGGQLQPGDYVLMLDAPNPGSVSGTLSQWPRATAPLQRLTGDGNFTLLRVLPAHASAGADHAP